MSLQNSTRIAVNILTLKIIADLHTNKCKTKESRTKAFQLLTLLTIHSAKVRESVYRDCLFKMVS